LENKPTPRDFQTPFSIYHGGKWGFLKGGMKGGGESGGNQGLGGHRRSQMVGGASCCVLKGEKDLGECLTSSYGEKMSGSDRSEGRDAYPRGIRGYA